MPEPTPEQIGREAGEAIANAIADNLEAVLFKMADAIARVQAEQAEIRDAILTINQRVERHEQRLDGNKVAIRSLLARNLAE